jgi:signal transduction histidine kinase
MAVATQAAGIVKMLMASAGAGADPTNSGPVDLAFVVEGALQLLTPSISKRAVVQSRLAKDLPSVRGNLAQIRQVVTNLIVNASEALGDQEGIITVTTERTHLSPGSVPASLSSLPQGDYVRLKVADTGCGMSNQTRVRVFDQFFTTKSLGRGLGLAAVQGIVRSHGGAIDVVSAPGAGTTFEVLFPCVSRGRNTSGRTPPAG